MLTFPFHFSRFNNLLVFPEKPKLTQFIPGYIIKIIIKILGYFWGVTGIMTESYSGPMIKLTVTNCSLWKSMMEDLLNYKDLYDPIEGDNVKSSDMSDTDWKKLKKKTLSVIRQWVDISLYNHVAKETDPHTLWKNLENMYETKNAQVKIFLMWKMMNLELKEGQSIAKHLNDFEGMIAQLSVASLSLDDETQACFLLDSLLDSWNTLVVSLRNLALEGKVALAMVRNSLFNEEI